MRTTLVVLALTLAAGVARAEGATVTLNVTDRPLAEVAAAIAKQGKVVVVVDPDRADKKVSVSMDGLPALNAVEKAARADGCGKIWLIRNVTTRPGLSKRPRCVRKG